MSGEQQSELTMIEQISLGAPEACRVCPVVRQEAYFDELLVATGRITLKAAQAHITRKFGDCGKGPKERPGLHDGAPRDYCNNSRRIY